MTFGLSAGAMMAISAGAAVAGSAISADAARSAANKQKDAANNATQAQRDMFDKTVQLEQPYNNAGVDAQNRLSYLLGISPSGYGGSGGYAPQAVGAGPSSTSPSRISMSPGIGPMAAPASATTMQNIGVRPTISQTIAGARSGNPNPSPVYDPTNPNNDPTNPTTWTGVPPSTFAGQPQSTQGGTSQQDALAQAQADPAFGSLMKPFGMDDFHLDPGIQFQIQQGNLALQNSQAAKDGVMSGAALKDLIGFNQGMAGTGYQSAFDRYMANKGFTYGALSDIANRGQAAAGNTVNSSGSFAKGMADTITGAGNAAASGIVGGANAISGGIQNAGNMFMLRSMMTPQSTSSPNTGFGTGSNYGNQDYGNFL